MEFRIPVSTKSVHTVTVNGKPAEWRTEAGFGRSVIVVQAPMGREAEVCVKWDEGIPSEPSQHVAATVGQSVELRVPQGEIVEVIDPTGLLRDMRIEGALVHATVMHAGHKVVMARVKTGDLEQWHIFKMAVRDPYAEAQKSAETLAAAPADAHWEPISLSGVLNADVRDVYKQKYLSPRVQTCSTQLGTDGFAPWTLRSWRCTPTRHRPVQCAQSSRRKGSFADPPRRAFPVARRREKHCLHNTIRQLPECDSGCPWGGVDGLRGSLWRARRTRSRRRLPMRF